MSEEEFEKRCERYREDLYVKLAEQNRISTEILLKLTKIEEKQSAQAEAIHAINERFTRFEDRTNSRLDKLDARLWKMFTIIATIAAGAGVAVDKIF